jgi:hypothetical protein
MTKTSLYVKEAFVNALHALRVDDPGAGLGISALLHPGLLPQRGQHQQCRAAHHGGQLAGHSVEVLLRIHAKCLDGGCALIRQCVQASLGHADTDRNVDTRWTQMLAHSRT